MIACAGFEIALGALAVAAAAILLLVVVGVLWVLITESRR